MIWVLATVLGLAAWLLVALFALGLCRAAASGDELGHACASADIDAEVIELRVFRTRPSPAPPRAAAAVSPIARA